MALATLTLTNLPPTSIDRTDGIVFGKITFSAPTDIYPVGGFLFDSVFKQMEQVKSTSGKPRWVQVQSTAGYIYQYIPATGKLMVLQVPPSGSLTTAAPLQEYPSAAISGIWADSVTFKAEYQRV